MRRSLVGDASCCHLSRLRVKFCWQDAWYARIVKVFLLVFFTKFWIWKQNENSIAGLKISNSSSYVESFSLKNCIWDRPNEDVSTVGAPRIRPFAKQHMFGSKYGSCVSQLFWTHIFHWEGSHWPPENSSARIWWFLPGLASWLKNDTLAVLRWPGLSSLTCGLFSVTTTWGVRVKELTTTYGFGKMGFEYLPRATLVKKNN